MTTTIRKLLTIAIISLSCHQVSAVTVVFDYSFDSNNFFGNPGSIQRNILESAGAFFTNNLTDSLTAITPGGTDQFNAFFPNPGSGATETVMNLSVPTDTIIVYAGGRSLPGTTLGLGGPGGFNVSTFSQAFLDNANSRGQGGNLTDSDPTNDTDFAPWGGAITFDTDMDANWYFDPDLSTDADVVGNDFFSVALHELGHLFGIGGANSWINLATGGMPNLFTGAASTAVFGGNVPLEADSGHWLEGTTGNGGAQEALMDPSLLQGTRKVFTDLDLAGLTDVGWQVIPVPAAIWLFGSSLLGLIYASRKHSLN